MESERQTRSPRFLLEGIEFGRRSSMSPYPPMPMPSLSRTQSSFIMNHGDSQLYRRNSHCDDLRRMESDFGEGIYCKSRNSSHACQVFPFQNDCSGLGREDLYVVFKVEGLPFKPDIKLDRKSPCKGRAMSHQTQLETNSSSKKKTKYNSITKKQSPNGLLVHDLFRLIDNLSQHSSADHDKEIEKLTRELREANNILHDIEINIDVLKEEKDISQQALLSIKSDHRNLLEEKNTCQKQILFIKKELNNYRIKDRRLVREFEQLNLCYGKLDQKERLMRRQISLLEAELSLVVSKLEAPKSNTKPIVPRLDLTKLKQPKKLPPVKNTLTGLHKIQELQQMCSPPPSVPRKLSEIIKVYDSKESPRKIKRGMWPQHSISSPILGNNTAKTIPSGHGTEGDNFFPLVGNRFPLSSRPDKDFKHAMTVTKHEDLILPPIKEDGSIQLQSLP